MKKYFLALFLFLFLTTPILAQEEVSPTPSPVQYQLPYPGILPDNTLYPLKTIRDRIIGILISDSLKKAEFNLLQADKRLSAGVSLFKKGKTDMAESVISKGENYFEDAIVKAEEAKKQEMHTKDIAANLFVASQKHEEVIKELTAKTKGEDKKKFEAILQRVQNIKKKVSKFNNVR